MIRVVLLALSLFFSAVATVHAVTDVVPVKRVLYLNSYDRGYRWSDEVERGLRERFTASGRNIELSVEYLDSRRFPGHAHIEGLTTAIAVKYAGYRPDLVVVSDNFAFDFAVGNRARLFPGLPVVFCGYNNFRPESIAGIDNITGVNEEIDIAKTVDLALKVQPATKTLVFILSTGDPSSKKNVDLVESSVLPKYRDRYHVVALKDASMAEIRQRLAGLPRETVVFLAGQTSDTAQGRAYTPVENGRLISVASPFTVYTFWDFHLNTGVLGGHIVTGFDQGRAAADMALRILDGTRAADIPVMMESPTSDIFDFTAMQRHGIAEGALPEGSVIINRPSSVWDTYRWYIIAALSALILESLLVIALLRSLRLRKEAVASLAQERDLLEQRVAERTVGLTKANKLLGDEIAERTRAEAEQRKITDRLSLACRAGGIGIWELDVVNKNLIWDDQMFKLYGITPDRFSCTYAAWRAGVHHDDLPKGEEELGMAMQGEKEFETEFRVVWPDDSIHTIRALANVQRDASGQASNLIGTNYDITELKQAEEALTAAKAAAEAANRAKSEFLANMSHEIRTPMNAIMGMTHLALRAEIEPPQRGYLEKIDTAAHSLLGIINDILDFSRIEAGKLELEQVAFSLDVLLGNLADIVGLKAEQKGLGIVISVIPETPRSLVGDALRLGQILLNLTDNAVKFTEKGEIVVAVTSEELSAETVRLQFSVRDTGIGMTPDQIERLFMSFSQADTSITRRYGGAGLGLAISRQFAELMGGCIEVESTPSQGSTFTLTVTVGIAPEGVPVTQYGESGQVRGQQIRVPHLAGRRVLLVEDNVINRDLVTELLADLGISVEFAENGREGVARATTESFDLVLMDIQMPEMDGLTATRLIRTQGFGDLPIVAMTAHAMSGDREKSLAAGMNDHLTKPIDLEKLTESLGRWLPAESIITSVPTPPPEPSPAGGGHVDLPDSRPPFDLPAALKRTNGKPRLLRKLLLRFHETCADAATELRRLLAEGSHDEARRLAHSLKGTAGILEAGELFEAAADVELALREGGIEEAVTLIDALERALIPALAAAATLERRPPAPLPRSRLPLDRGELDVTLVELRSLIAARNLKARKLFAQVSGDLAEAGAEGDVDELGERLDRLEFPAALVVLERLMESTPGLSGKS
jgi:signal transduction histidine kinase/HPt (histidine-containing phosphotransfer) domain-containing protein/ActR/RegA family two-component response regulator